MSDETEISTPIVSVIQKPAKRTWRWVSTILAACALALGAYGVSIIVSYQQSNNEILQQIQANPPHTARDIVCVALQLNGGFNGPEGALDKQEFKNANLPMDYCDGFSLPKKK